MLELPLLRLEAEYYDPVYAVNEERSSVLYVDVFALRLGRQKSRALRDFLHRGCRRSGIVMGRVRLQVHKELAETEYNVVPTLCMETRKVNEGGAGLVGGPADRFIIH